MNREPIFVIIEPCLKDSQSMFLLNRYAFSPTDKNYHLKSQSLQVISKQFSGVTLLSSCMISMGLTICSNVTLDSSALFVYQVRLTSFSLLAVTCACAVTALVKSKKIQKNAQYAGLSFGRPLIITDHFALFVRI